MEYKIRTKAGWVRFRPDEVDSLEIDDEKKRLIKCFIKSYDYYKCFNECKDFHKCLLLPVVPSYFKTVD